MCTIVCSLKEAAEVISLTRGTFIKNISTVYEGEIYLEYEGEIYLEYEGKVLPGEKNLVPIRELLKNHFPKKPFEVRYSKVILIYTTQF